MDILVGKLDLITLRLPRRGGVAFVEAVESYRVVVKHLAFELAGEILARF